MTPRQRKADFVMKCLQEETIVYVEALGEGHMIGKVTAFGGGAGPVITGFGCCSLAGGILGNSVEKTTLRSVEGWSMCDIRKANENERAEYRALLMLHDEPVQAATPEEEN